MDAYTHVLDQLRKDDCRRLRNYASNRESKFTTWLVVVARRACIDFHRVRYGRARAADSTSARDRRSVRRKLLELTAVPEDLASVADEDSLPADRQVLDGELSTGLQQALDTLSPSDRLIVALRFEEELSAAEIAKLVMMPSPFHVYRRLNEILGRLRVILRRHGFESTLI